MKLGDVISCDNSGEVISKEFWNDGDEILYTCSIKSIQSNYANFPTEKRTDIGDVLISRNGRPYIHYIT